MTTRTPSCDWVRTRLPLEIGPDDGDFGGASRRSADPRGVDRGEDAGLDARDRAKLARHLADCAACRLHRAELIDAMSALSAASAIVPIGHDSPSLWPALELRIREQKRAREQRAKSPARLASILSFASAGRPRPLPNGSRRSLARIRGAALEAIAGPLDRCRDFLPEWELKLRPGIAFGGLVAALLGGVIALQADRAQSRDRLKIAQGARPIVPAAAPPPAASTDRELEAEIDVAAEDGGNRWLWHSSPRTFIASPEEDGSEESRSGVPGPLAQAEIHPAPRPNTVGGPVNPGSGYSGAPSSTPSSSSKYDFDLERGTPMAPDSRDAKPAY